MKMVKFTSKWGSTELLPGNQKPLPSMYITNIGPRGGSQRSNYISPLEALAMAAYLQAWALEVLK